MQCQNQQPVKWIDWLKSKMPIENFRQLFCSKKREKAAANFLKSKVFLLLLHLESCWWKWWIRLCLWLPRCKKILKPYKIFPWSQSLLPLLTSRLYKISFKKFTSSSLSRMAKTSSLWYLLNSSIIAAHRKYCIWRHLLTIPWLQSIRIHSGENI